MLNKHSKKDDVIQLMTQVTRKKKIQISSNRSRTYDLLVTSPDALPLSYRRLVGAKAIKAGVNLNAIFAPFNMGLMQISRSRFKQSKNSMFKT